MIASWWFLARAVWEAWLDVRRARTTRLEGQDMDQRRRAYAYRVALAVSALLVAYGLVSETEAAQWAVLVAALLGMGTDALASKHTDRKDITHG